MHRVPRPMFPPTDILKWCCWSIPLPIISNLRSLKQPWRCSGLGLFRAGGQTGYQPGTCAPIVLRTHLSGSRLARRGPAEVRRLSEVLLPHLEAGRVVVGLEASCVVNLRDDAQTLGLGEPVETVGNKILLFEEFLAREVMAKRLNTPALHGRNRDAGAWPLPSESGRGHEAMRRVQTHPRITIFDDRGRLGMAGTFSLEAEHAEMASPWLNEADARLARQAHGSSHR